MNILFEMKKNIIFFWDATRKKKYEFNCTNIKKNIFTGKMTKNRDSPGSGSSAADAAAAEGYMEYDEMGSIRQAAGELEGKTAQAAGKRVGNPKSMKNAFRKRRVEYTGGVEFETKFDKCRNGYHTAPGYDKFRNSKKYCVRNCKAWDPARIQNTDGTCTIKGKSGAKKKKSAKKGSGEKAKREPTPWMRFLEKYRKYLEANHTELYQGFKKKVIATSQSARTVWTKGQSFDDVADGAYAKAAKIFVRLAKQ